MLEDIVSKRWGFTIYQAVYCGFAKTKGESRTFQKGEKYQARKVGLGGRMI